MALGRTQRDKMTDFEREEFQQEKTVVEMQLEHAQKMKEMELEIARLEARFSSWLKLPLIVITLPVRVVLALGYAIGMIRKQPDPEFWKNIWKN